MIVKGAFMKRIMWFCIIGFLLISMVGSLLHFAYEWSGENAFVGFFCAVNESTWEHVKIALTPMFLWGAAGLFIIRNKNYGFAVFIALLTVIVLIPSIFYLYTAFTGKSILGVDISIFFISIALAMVFAWLILRAKPFKGSRVLGCVGCVLVLLCFSIFTFFPPKWELFKDPINNNYGINRVM